MAELEIFVDPEFRALIPSLSGEEYRQLDENLVRDGCREPLSVWRNGKSILLDGHNRLKICEEHGLRFNTIEIEIADRDGAKIWIIQNQFGQCNPRVGAVTRSGARSSTARLARTALLNSTPVGGAGRISGGQRSLDSGDRSTCANRTTTVQVGATLPEPSPAGVGVDRALDYLRRQQLNRLANMVFDAHARGDDGAGAELLGDPLHRSELRGGDHQPACLAAEARFDLELARGVDAVVVPNLGDDPRGEVGERKL